MRRMKLYWATVLAIADDALAVRTSVCISRLNTYFRVRSMLYQIFLLSEPNTVLSRVRGSKATADFKL
jgi:hypothetical protein